MVQTHSHTLTDKRQGYVICQDLGLAGTFVPHLQIEMLSAKYWHGFYLDHIIIFGPAINSVSSKKINILHFGDHN